MTTTAKRRNKDTVTSDDKDNYAKESISTRKTKYWDPLTDGVKWIENYTEALEKFFIRLPDFISTFIATFAVFTFGAILRGKIILY